MYLVCKTSCRDVFQLGTTTGERWWPSIVLRHPDPCPAVRYVKSRGIITSFAIESGMYQTRQKQPTCNSIINSISTRRILIAGLMHPADHNLIPPSERLRSADIAYGISQIDCNFSRIRAFVLISG